MKKADLDDFNKLLDETPNEQKTHFQKMVSKRKKCNSMDVLKEANDIYAQAKSGSLPLYDMNLLIQSLEKIQKMKIAEEEQINKYKELAAVEPLKIKVAGNDAEKKTEDERIKEIEKEVKAENGLNGNGQA